METVRCLVPRHDNTLHPEDTLPKHGPNKECLAEMCDFSYGQEELILFNALTCDPGNGRAVLLGYCHAEDRGISNPSHQCLIGVSFGGHSPQNCAFRKTQSGFWVLISISFFFLPHPLISFSLA